MRSPEDILADIEGDFTSRESEIKLIERLITKTSNAPEIAMLRRSLILLTYAHLEGFCKFALMSYSSAINSLSLPCSQVSYPIAAASLSGVFKALRDPSSKHDVFRSVLPDDSKLHLVAREQKFIDTYESTLAQQAVIPDHVVDTQSNLSMIILKKIMFVLGLPHQNADTHQANIGKLLGMRNAIAHGDRLKIPTEKDIEEYLKTTFVVMKFVKEEVYQSLKDQKYLRAIPSPTPTPAAQQPVTAN